MFSIEFAKLQRSLVIRTALSAVTKNTGYSVRLEMQCGTVVMGCSKLQSRKTDLTSLYCGSLVERSFAKCAIESLGLGIDTLWWDDACQVLVQ